MKIYQMRVHIISFHLLLLLLFTQLHTGILNGSSFQPGKQFLQEPKERGESSKLISLVQQQLNKLSPKSPGQIFYRWRLADLYLRFNNDLRKSLDQLYLVKSIYQVRKLGGFPLDSQIEKTLACLYYRELFSKKGSYQKWFNQLVKLSRENFNREFISSSKGNFLTIATFNIRLFSNRSRSDQELNKIAEVMKNFDLIAIQEIRDAHVVRRLVKVLEKKYNRDYECLISPKIGRGVKEIYAFVFRTDKVKALGKPRLYPERDDEFIREPFFAYFKAGNFDFYLVTIHVLWGKSKRRRRPEIHELANVFRFFQEDDPIENDVILLGDFNFSPHDNGWSSLKNLPTMLHVFNPPLKSTIFDTHLYDNIWFQKKYLKEYTGKSGIDRFDETLFNDDNDAASKAVSDHRPLWAIFRTDMTADE